MASTTNSGPASRALDDLSNREIRDAVFAAHVFGRQLDGAQLAVREGTRLWDGLVALHLARRIRISHVVYRRQRDGSLMAHFDVSRPRAGRLL